MVTGGTERFGVLVASGGAAWEGSAVEAIAEVPYAVLLRRCLDLTELLAAAATGSARVAVVAHHLPDLDADAVARLGSWGTRVVVLGDDRADRERLERIGVAAVVPAVDDTFGAVLRAAARAAEEQGAAPAAPPVEAEETPVVTGRTVGVWGAHGAPGRTTVAVGVAAALARRGQPTLLLDLDPYGGAVAQHLGVTDEVSGLLAAMRAQNSGLLDRTRLAGAARRVSADLRVLTGLPRPDRWRELRATALDQLLDQAAGLDPWVVVDIGPGLEPYDDGGASRDAWAGAAVAGVDVLVAVASPDPVGLSRAARALVDLAEVRPQGADVVVVNRWRRGLGWSVEEVTDLLRRAAPRSEILVVPDDRAGVDRALREGRPPVGGRGGTVGRSLEELADLLRR